MGIIRPGLSLTLYKAATLPSPLQLFSSSVPSSPLIPVCLFVCLQLLIPGVLGNLFPNQIKAVLQITHTHNRHQPKHSGPKQCTTFLLPLLPSFLHRPCPGDLNGHWARGLQTPGLDCSPVWAEAEPCLILQVTFAVTDPARAHGAGIIQKE